MSLRLWRNCIAEAWINMTRNGLMSLAAVTTVAASMVTLGALYLFVRDLNQMVGKYASETMVTVFVDRKLDENASLRVKDQVETLSHVASVEYVSKQQGVKWLMERYGNRLGDLPATLRMPAQIVVKVDDAANAETVAQEARRIAGVEKVNSAAAVTSGLVTVRAAVQRGGLLAVIILGLVALLTVNNAVHLTITAREREIQIMQLVGATAWYVGTPFLLEGAIQGFLGGILALPVMALGHGWLIEYIQSRLAFIPLTDPRIGLATLGPLVLGAGMLFGVLGSYISVRRLLHVG